MRWSCGQAFHNDLQFYAVHKYRVYDITSCVDVRWLLGRTKILECGVTINLEARMRSIIESAIADGSIDLEAIPLYNDDGNRVYTRYLSHM